MFIADHPQLDEQRHQPQARRRGRQARGAGAGDRQAAAGRARQPVQARADLQRQGSSSPTPSASTSPATRQAAGRRTGRRGPWRSSWRGSRSTPTTCALMKTSMARLREGEPARSIGSAGQMLGAGGQRRVMEHELRGEGPTAVLVHGLTVDRRVMIEAFDAPLADGGRAAALRRSAGPRRVAGRRGAAPRPTRFVDELAALVRSELPPARARRASSRRRSSSATPTAATWRRALRARARRRARAASRAARSSSPTSRAARSRRGAWRRASRSCRSPTTRASARRSSRWPCSMTRPVLERFQRAVHPANIAADARGRRGGARALRAVAAARRRARAARRAVDDRVRARRSLGRLAGRGAAGGAAARARTSWCCPTAGTCCRSSSRCAFAQAVRDFLARCLLTTAAATSAGGALPLTAETVTMICVCWISSLASIFTHALAAAADDVEALLLDEPPRADGAAERGRAGTRRR